MADIEAARLGAVISPFRLVSGITEGKSDPTHPQQGPSSEVI